MTFSANVPTYLQGQLVSRVFDMGLGGVPAASVPTGALGSTVSNWPFGLMRQAIDLGFTSLSTTPGA